MFLKLLLLLLRKNIVTAWRGKAWIFAEIFLPLLLMVPYTYFGFEKPAIVPAETFESFRVTGDWRDFKRHVGRLSTIYKTLCLRSKYIGIAFSNGTGNEKELRFIADKLEKRYNNEMLGDFNITVRIFDTSKTLDAELVKDNATCGKYMGGIVFSEFNSRLSYKIRLSSPFGSWYTGNEIWKYGDPFTILNDHNPVPGTPSYWSSGFLSLQFAVNSIFLSRGNSTFGQNYILRLERMPEPEHFDKSINFFLSLLVFFWFLALIPFVIHSTAKVVAEKESGMMAYLMVMGLRPSVYFTSHFIFALVEVFLILIPPCIILLFGLILISWSLFIIAILIYGIGLVSFVMLMSTMFHSSTTALKASLLIWFLSIVLNRDLAILYSTNYGIFLHSLNINAAFYRAIEAVQNYLQRDTYLGWENCFDGSSSPFPFGLSLIMMIIDIIWMILLASYLSQVYPPGEIPAKSFFFFLPFCKKEEMTLEKMDDSTDRMNVSNENIQIDERGIGLADIDIRNLTKKYSTLKAVDALSFKAYRGNVTVLLGHNGAGKSTTFSMITGVSKPTSGIVRICREVLSSSSLTHCQKNVGYCPQYNPIFDLLTVREHLEFFRKLKNNRDNFIDSLINEVGLGDKANEIAKNLSGGMKRKLCVAMSLIGGSQIVLLDEPTAGMDLGSRHMIRDLLERYKCDRTILLTTHYMDEADALGDRIAIMVKGKLVCSGTSEFLKARFGTGYLLAVDLKDPTNITNRRDSIMKAVQCFVNSARIQSASAHQLTILLPTEHKKKFSDLFLYLEANACQFGISSFGVSLNTLEQVFLTVGEFANQDAINYDGIDFAKRHASKLCNHSHYFENHMVLFLVQIFALIRKRAVCYIRKPSRLISQFFIPLLLFIMTSFAMKTTVYTLNEVKLNPDKLVPSVVLLQFDRKLPLLENSFTNFLNGIKGYETRYANLQANLSEIILQTPKVLPPLALVFSTSLEGDHIKIVAFFNGKAIHGPVIAMSLVHNVLLSKEAGPITLSLLPYEQEKRSTIFVSENGQSVIVYWISIFILSLISSGFISFLVDERSSKFLYQQFLTGLSRLTYWISVVLSDFIFYIITCFCFLIIFIISNWLVNYRVAVMLLWLLYFWSVMPFTYCASLLFLNSTKAYAAVMSLNLVVSLGALLIVQGLSLYNPSLIGYIDSPLLILLPSYAYLNALISLVEAEFAEVENIYQWKLLGRTITFMCISGVAYWFLLAASQSRRFCLFLASIWNMNFHRNTITEGFIEEDVDVMTEREHMERTANCELALAVRGISKYYGRFCAVNNLTFGVRPDECFGLLGVNGAGKTSTFDILTGTSFCSNGKAFLNGHSFNGNQRIGFCPQFDALLDYLTAKEILQLMASLCGFTDVNQRVQSVLEAVHLIPQANNIVRCYSGGQKRRLSLGIALISQARLILLDEPTAGIDPKARRQIWDVLTAMRDKGCAILLTSHSMDECEALCSRIGIMHHGSLMAIGSPQHIKSRFGEGYTLTVTLKSKAGKDDVIQSVKRLFPESSFKTLTHPLHLVWHIGRRDGDRWSVFFEKADHLASMHSCIADYSFAQATLEEAFLRLSQQGDDHIERVERHVLPLSTLL